MIASFEQSARRGSIPALVVTLLLAVTALTGAEETAMAKQAPELSAATPAAPETTILLARETPPVRSLPLPAETAESSAPEPQATAPVEAPATIPATVTESKPAAPSAPAASTPVKADKNRTKAAKNAAAPAAMAAPSPAATEDNVATPAPVEKPAGKNPATLHSAINKTAKDYADSLEVKSTRPGEELPFTLTVGGSIQVRGEYWSGMPKHNGLSGGDHFATSTRTRVSLCADFGQVQCVMEASRTQGGARLFGPRDVD